MIKKALIILPDQRKKPANTDQVNPLLPIGGLNLLQRIIYSLQWAGIEEGLIVSHTDSPEIRRYLRRDKKNRSFIWQTWGSSAESDKGKNELKDFLKDDFILYPLQWIVDRKTLQTLCQQDEPLTGPILLTPGDRTTETTVDLPPPALIPGKQHPKPVQAIIEKQPYEQIMSSLYDMKTADSPELPDAAFIPVAENSDIRRAEEKLFQGLTKSTESYLTQKVQRPISMAISRRLLYTRVTPNQISIVSILIGLFGALGFLSDYQVVHFTGGLMLLFSSIIDGCDGELARLRFQESKFGSLLDFLGDNLVHIAVFLAIGIGLYLRGAGTIYIFLGGLAAASTLAAATSVFFRVFLKSGSAVITFATPVHIEEMDKAEGKLRQRIDFVDKISNRDFIYLIVFLAAIGQLWIFSWVSALGSTFYIFNLLYLYKKMAAIKEASPVGAA